MKVIIIGAGELGQLVAAKLSSLKHDIVIVDSRPENLEHAGEALDTRLLIGAGTDVGILKRAGAKDADLLLALSGDEATNILACAMARQLGTKRAICRIFSKNTFSEMDGVTPASFHIDETFSPIEESVNLIHGILQNRILQQRIECANPDALLDVVNIPLNSAITGLPLKDLPCTEQLKTVRLAAIIRKRELVVPHGDTVLMPGDKVYVAGKAHDVNAFVEWLASDGSVPVRRVVIAGISPISEELLRKLLDEGYDVRVIDADYAKSERLLASLPKNIMLIQGEGTDMDILQEAGVDSCDAFAALSGKDKNNILSCLLASRLGARKVIALTSTAEYMDILPAIEQAGCWFNTTQIAANTAFRLISASKTIRVDPELRAVNARLEEMTLTEKSKYAGKTIRECKLPKEFLIALIIRGNEVLAPTGETTLQAGDQLVAIANAPAAEKFRRNL